MHEPEEQNWHQKPAVRVILLLLLPLVVGGLFFISLRLTLWRPWGGAPVEPEPDNVESVR